jgi:hypothetical protein
VIRLMLTAVVIGLVAAAAMQSGKVGKAMMENHHRKVADY